MLLPVRWGAGRVTVHQGTAPRVSRSHGDIRRDWERIVRREGGTVHAAPRGRLRGRSAAITDDLHLLRGSEGEPPQGALAAASGHLASFSRGGSRLAALRPNASRPCQRSCAAGAPSCARLPSLAADAKADSPAAAIDAGVHPAPGGGGGRHCLPTHQARRALPGARSWRTPVVPDRLSLGAGSLEPLGTYLFPKLKVARANSSLQRPRRRSHRRQGERRAEPMGPGGHKSWRDAALALAPTAPNRDTESA